MTNVGSLRRSLCTADQSRNELGVALLATLVTLIIMGVIAVIMFNTLGGTPTGPATNPTIPGATTTAPVTPENGGQEAAVAACRANYVSIEAALTDYRALNGSLPSAGTEWATSATNGGPLLQVWPEGRPYYTITWNGSQLSVLPISGASSHGSDGTSSSKSGCFAA